MSFFAGRASLPVGHFRWTSIFAGWVFSLDGHFRWMGTLAGWVSSLDGHFRWTGVSPGWVTLLDGHLRWMDWLPCWISAHVGLASASLSGHCPRCIVALAQLLPLLCCGFCGVFAFAGLGRGVQSGFCDIFA